MKVDVSGTYKVRNKTSFKPGKKCVACPFFDEYGTWCQYLKKKIDDWEYYAPCPVKEITVEE